jgi:predicted nucleic acid-binding protein
MGALGEIPSGSQVFIDANIFIYHFGGDGDIADACTEFLLRVENRDVRAFTSTVILTEVLHRLMIIEAIEKYDLPLKGIVKHLKEHPDVVMGLDKYSIAPEKIRQMNVITLVITLEDVLDSKRTRESYGLLTNDSMSISVMKRFGISNIATNDSDFERIAGIEVWKPLA